LGGSLAMARLAKGADWCGCGPFPLSSPAFPAMINPPTGDAFVSCALQRAVVLRRRLIFPRRG